MLSLIPRSPMTPSPLKSHQPVTEFSNDFDYLPAEILSEGSCEEEQEYHQRKDPHPLI